MNTSTEQIKIPEFLKSIYEIFSKHHFECYLVGGAVRDMLMGLPVHDYDVATNARARDVMKIFPRTIPTGIAHGTVTILFHGEKIEVTTFRSENDYTDGRHPKTVCYNATLSDDLNRRDFTMNALAYDIGEKKLIDLFDGKSDIEKKITRAVGNPLERFTEDGLRSIRAIRFASQLGFSIEDETLRAMKNPKSISTTKKISVERFRDEFIKILQTETPSRALKLLEENGITEIFIPELLTCKNCEQSDARNFHKFDVLEHLYFSCDGASRENLIVRLAALFHDIGKAKTKTIEKKDGIEIIRFFGHEKIGSEMTRKILQRLKFPTKIIEKVSHLVLHHMFHYESVWSNAAVRRFIIRVGEEALADLFELRLADVFGMQNEPVRFHDSEVGKNLTELKTRIEKILKQGDALSLKDLKINGNDIAKLGVKDGKKIGFILKNLLQTVLDEPRENEKEKLLALAKKMMN